VITSGNRKRLRKQLNTAYGCFLFCGLMILFTIILSYIPMDNGTAGTIGFLILVPLFLIWLITNIAGLWLAIKLWHYSEFRILTCTTLIVIIEMLSEAGPAELYNTVLLLYAVITTILPLRWFFVRRKQFDQATTDS